MSQAEAVTSARRPLMSGICAGDVFDTREKMSHCPGQTKQFCLRTDFPCIRGFAKSFPRFRPGVMGVGGYPTFEEQRSKDKTENNWRADFEMNFDGVEKLTANPTSHTGVLTPVGGAQGHRRSSSSRRHVTPVLTRPPPDTSQTD